MKRSFVLFSLFGFMVLGLVACGSEPTRSPEPTATAVSENIAPTATDQVATVPPTDEPATPTAEPPPTETEPTSEPLFPTPEVTATATASPVPTPLEYTITILEPGAAATLLAGGEVSFRGVVEPPTTDPLLLTVTLGAYTAVSAEIIPDGSSGSWELNTNFGSSASGPGVLTVTLADRAQAEQPLNLAFDSTTDEPTIALSRPVPGETAVGGYAFFFQGESNNLIDDAFTIGVLVDDCTNFIAAQRISLSSGSWYGFVILPQNAAAGPACAVAYTGEYGEGSWRETLIPIQLRAYDDPQAALLSLGNLGELAFSVGSATDLFGVAANVPDGAVDIELVLDSTSGSQLVATGKAFADQFGLWSIRLDVPEDAPSGPGLLTISAGEGDSYQEVRQVVTIAP